jgi:HAE1 family hydrophobic/amphiphilic exporter-1
MDSSNNSQRRPDWNARLVEFALNNSRLIWLVIIGLVIGGAFSLSILRREGFPQVSPKMVMVQTVWPGATPQEVERQVTIPVESAIKDAKGIKEYSSTSANSFSSVLVTLDDKTNLDTGVQDIQSKVQSMRGQLPNDAEAPKVETFSSGGSAFILGVTDGANLDTSRDHATLLTNELLTVKGIKSVKRINQEEKRVQVEFRSADLSANGVSLQTIQLILQGNNVNFPAGRLDIADKAQSIVSVGAFTSLDDIRQLMVGVNPVTKRPVKLIDVAEVSEAYDSTDVFQRVGVRNGADKQLQAQPGILLSIEVTSDSDIIKVRQAMFDKIQQLADAKSFSRDSVSTLYDQGQSTADQITEILSGAIGAKSNLWLLGGFQLLFLAMLFFVNWRAAIVSALAIPFSFGFTFIALALTGIQLNTIVLFSLILVLGLIVDPAIVMIESIQRYRDLKYDNRHAVLESGRRYGASLFMAVLTSMIVFLPFGVVSGMFGQIIKYIPLTVIPALVASYFVPIALLPLLTKYILHEHKEEHAADGRKHEIEGLWPIAEWFMKANRWFMANRWRAIGTFVGLFLLVGASVGLVGMGKIQVVQFSTPKDNPQISIEARFERGLTKADRDATAQKIEQLLQRENGVDNYFYYSQNQNSIYIFANLKSLKDRKSANDKSKAIVGRIRTDSASIPHVIDTLVNELSIGPPTSDYQIQTQVYDNDATILANAAKDIGGFLGQQANVVKVDDGFTNRTEPQIAVELDRNRVQSAGLSSFEIGQQLKVVMEESKVTTFTSATGTQESVVLISASKPDSLDSIKNLPLVNQSGRLVKVQDVANVVETSSVDNIQRFSGARFASIQARVNEQKNVLTVQKALDKYLTKDKLAELKLDSRDNRGQFDEIAKSFTQLGIALVVAIILTYLFLVLQFKSFSQPMIMLVTIPLSLIGVFPALWLVGADLGFLELLGVTILVGIVENVGIFLIDYANQLVKEQGLSAKDAIIQAVGVRFRPIVLTKLVALGGLLPLAIESEFWRGLSVVIIAGIGLSGFLSLITIPVVYVWISHLRERVHKKPLAEIS